MLVRNIFFFGEGRGGEGGGKGMREVEVALLRGLIFKEVDTLLHTLV